jgi:hypothetical protein
MTPDELKRAVKELTCDLGARIENVVLKAVDTERNELSIAVGSAQISVPAFNPGALSFAQDQVGKIGGLEPRSDHQLQQLAGGYVFVPYLDQSLKRVYEMDRCKKGVVTHAWTCDRWPGGFLVAPGLVPGTDGAWLPRNSQMSEVEIPSEFSELCNEVGLEPVDVLRGFIADLCNLQNMESNPREDGFSSNGSDERDMAESYFERTYGVFREERSRFLQVQEARQALDEERDERIEQLELAMEDFLDAGGDFSGFIAAVAALKPDSPNQVA